MNRVFLDTNILLRLFSTAAPEHALVRSSVELLESRGDQLMISLQVLVETWVVSTRPIEANGFGWPVALVHTALQSVQHRFGMLLDDTTTADRWTGIVLEHSVRGKRAHDARIVAIMASHGISYILTLNDQDFTGMPGVIAVHPLSLIE